MTSPTKVRSRLLAGSIVVAVAGAVVVLGLVASPSASADGPAMAIQDQIAAKEPAADPAPTPAPIALAGSAPEPLSRPEPLVVSTADRENTGRPAPAELRHAITEALARNSGGQALVSGVYETPLQGIYEVTTSRNDVLYTDGTGRFALIDGHLLDTVNRIDHTSRRQDEILRVDSSSLPLNLAIRTGSGSRVIAVFEDPACPNCRQFVPTLAAMPDVTVFHFPYPVVGPDSPAVTRTAWCSPMRDQIWQRLMIGERMQPDPQPSCDTSAIDKILEDPGEQLSINNTPTVILSNGRRLEGAVAPAQLLDAITRAHIESGPVKVPAQIAGGPIQKPSQKPKSTP